MAQPTIQQRIDIKLRQMQLIVDTARPSMGGPIVGKVLSNGDIATLRNGLRSIRDLNNQNK